MKSRTFYKIFGLAFLAFIFQSRSNGPAAVAGLQVTGAPGNGTCANSGCHTTGSFDATLDIELLDNGAAIDKYEPGKAYTIRVTVSNGSGNPSGYGFQATSLDESANKVGTFEAGSEQHVVSTGGRDYLEHDLFGSSSVFESTWTAPDADAGTVTFYSAGIAANGNGGSSGDGTAVNTLAIEEDIDNAIFSNERDYATIVVTPNPVADQLKLSINSRAAGNFDLRISDLSGRIIRTEAIFLSSGENEASFSVEGLESGYYSVQLCGENHVTSVQMLKL
ncbi:MAG: hypothetical protein ACI9XO_004730 [Paraglaciecola sp.]|jgi:hypothetical protein